WSARPRTGATGRAPRVRRPHPPATRWRGHRTGRRRRSPGGAGGCRILARRRRRPRILLARGGGRAGIEAWAHTDRGAPEGHRGSTLTRLLSDPDPGVVHSLRGFRREPR